MRNSPFPELPARRDARREGLTRRGLLIGAASLAAGCAVARRPPLEELYRQTSGASPQPPLIVIPGAFGSVLRDARRGREIWPGSRLALLTSNYDRLGLEFDEDSLEPLLGQAQPGDVFERALGRDFYGDLLWTLERVGGFVRMAPGQPLDPGRRSYYVYAYDFRLDLTLAAAGLAKLITHIREAYGDAALRVDVLAHSNGGQLARYFARHGAAPMADASDPPATLEGARAIRRLVLVGTANLGSIQPVLSHVRGEEVVLRHVSPAVVATCPGVPQAMPHPAQPWLLNARGDVVQLDVFDTATWRELGWSIFAPEVRERTIARHGGGARGARYLERLEQYLAKHLARGRRFLELLARPSAEGDVEPFVLGGDCEPTLARIVAEEQRGAFVAREEPGAVNAATPGADLRARMFEPGDLVVTRASALGRIDGNAAAPPPLRIAHSVFLCEQHQYLTGNASFQDNVLGTLLNVMHP